MNKTLVDDQDTEPRSRHRGRSNFRKSCAALGLALIGAVGISAPAFAAPPFELDGNATSNDFPGDDWQNIFLDTDSALATTGIIDDPQGPDETIFQGGGSKDEQDVPNWKYRFGNPPDKDDITNGYAAAYINADDGHQVLVFGMDRFDTSGDAQLGFWFLGDSGVQPIDPGNTFGGEHDIGDLLVLVNFSGGGDTPTIEVWQWQMAGLVQLVAGNDVECEMGWIPSGEDFCGITNSANATSPWPYLDKDGDDFFEPAAFFEGAIDLTALGIDACITNFLAESRSSTSITATLKDVVSPEEGFQVCGITVTKNCTNPRLNASEDMIIYDISGGVTPTGGTVYSVALSDNPAADGAFQLVECGNPANVLGSFPLMSLAAGVEACYLNTITVPLASNGAPDTVTATANTDPDGVSGTDLTDSATDTCPILPISPMVMVDKDCETVIDISGGLVAAKVTISGQVCNTGDTTLSNVQVEDSEAGVVLSGVTLAPMECSNYMGMYTPTTAVDGTGTATTDPAEVTFRDTVTATALDIFGQAITPANANACCTLCPSSEGEQCGNGSP